MSLIEQTQLSIRSSVSPGPDTDSRLRNDDYDLLYSYLPIMALPLELAPPSRPSSPSSVSRVHDLLKERASRNDKYHERGFTPPSYGYNLTDLCLCASLSWRGQIREDDKEVFTAEELEIPATEAEQQPTKKRQRQTPSASSQQEARRKSDLVINQMSYDTLNASADPNPILSLDAEWSGSATETIGKGGNSTLLARTQQKADSHSPFISASFKTNKGQPLMSTPKRKRREPAVVHSKHSTAPQLQSIQSINPSSSSPNILDSSLDDNSVTARSRKSIINIPDLVVNPATSVTELESCTEVPLLLNGLDQFQDRSKQQTQSSTQGFTTNAKSLLNVKPTPSSQPQSPTQSRTLFRNPTGFESLSQLNTHLQQDVIDFTRLLDEDLMVRELGHHHHADSVIM